MGVKYMGKVNLSYLRELEVIELNSGVRLGKVEDLIIDTEMHKVVSILVSKPKGLFKINDCLEVPWAKIKRIGSDVIIIDGVEYIEKAIT